MKKSMVCAVLVVLALVLAACSIPPTVSMDDRRWVMTGVQSMSNGKYVAFEPGREVDTASGPFEGAAAVEMYCTAVRDESVEHEQGEFTFCVGEESWSGGYDLYTNDDEKAIYMIAFEGMEGSAELFAAKDGTATLLFTTKEYKLYFRSE